MSDDNRQFFGVCSSVMLRTIAAAIVVGLLLKVVGIFLTGFTAAIAAPIWFFEVLPSLVALIIWDSLVVQLLGFGATAFLMSYFANFLFELYWKLFALFAFAVVQAYFLYEVDFQFENYSLFWFPHWIVLVVCLFFGSNVGANRLISSKVEN